MPYGERNILNGDQNYANSGADPDGAEWTVDTNGSDFGFLLGFQGKRFEAETGNWNFNARYQNPVLGTFQQRDPIGNYPARSGNDVSSDLNHPLNAEGRAVRKTAERFSYDHANDRSLWQYADGMNIYQFIGSNPINASDPSGLDRYVVGSVHTGVGVDIWEKDKNGNWKVIGQKQFDFSAPHDWTFVFGLVAIPGVVVARDGIDEERTPIPSTAEQDQALLAALEATVNNPPVYTLAFGFTCRQYTNLMIRVGMDKK